MKYIPYLFLLFCHVAFPASYSDDFTGYSGALESETDWAGIVDGFDCSSGTCTGDNAQTSVNLALWDSGTMATEEYYVSVDATSVYQGPGVVVASNAAGNDYIICLYRGEWQGGTGMEIRHESGQLAAQGTEDWGTSVEVKCEWDADGDVNMYIDDAHILTATTPTDPGAYVGITTDFDGAAVLDNFAAVDTAVVGGAPTAVYNHLINQ